MRIVLHNVSKKENANMFLNAKRILRLLTIKNQRIRDLKATQDYIFWLKSCHSSEWIS